MLRILNALLPAPYAGSFRQPFSCRVLRNRKLGRARPGWPFGSVWLGTHWPPDPDGARRGAGTAARSPHRPRASEHAHALIAQASGLAITTAQTFNLNQANAAEFYEVYKGVIPEYMKKIVELTSGPCVAIEVCGEGVVGRLRDVAGPHDPDIGRVVRPSTVRAQFGLDKVKNAVHVTDLEEDGQLEVEYFFNLLARAC